MRIEALFAHEGTASLPLVPETGWILPFGGVWEWESGRVHTLAATSGPTWGKKSLIFSWHLLRC